MDKKTKQIFEERARIIKALAHTTRLYIVDQLKDQRLCVQELTDLIQADISTVSKHLSVLKNAGLVSDEKEGQMVYYSLKVPCVLNFFSCVESVMNSSNRQQLRIINSR